jgi:hypothetical protein
MKGKGAAQCVSQAWEASDVGGACQEVAVYAWDFWQRCVGEGPVDDLAMPLAAC